MFLEERNLKVLENANIYYQDLNTLLFQYSKNLEGTKTTSIFFNSILPFRYSKNLEGTKTSN